MTSWVEGEEELVGEAAHKPALKGKGTAVESALGYSGEEHSGESKGKRN